MSESVGQDLEALPDVHSPVAPPVSSIPAEQQHAPREATPRVRRRAWAEPRVKAWVLVATVAALMITYLLVSQFLTYRRDAWLFENGRKVDATVVRVETAVTPGQGYSNVPVKNVGLKYEVGGEEIALDQYLDSFDGDRLEVGKPITIRVDPADPRRFTARQNPVTLLPHLVAAAVVSPLLPATLAFAAWRRGRLLRIWETGELMPAVVMRTHGVAVAPSARAVECAGTDPDDRTVRHAYAPAARGSLPPAKGDLIWLIVPVGGKGPAIAASWFADPV